MDWETLKKWLNPFGHGRQRSSAPFTLPSVVVEVEPHFVAGARLANAAHKIEKLWACEVESGALAPLFHRPNLANEGAVRNAIGEVTTQIGNGNGKWGLLLPDAVVR